MPPCNLMLVGSASGASVTPCRMDCAFEIEGDFRNNQFAHGRDFGFPAGAGGREMKYGPMFNVLYDVGHYWHRPPV